MTAAVHLSIEGSSAMIEWASIILKMAAMVCIKYLQLIGFGRDHDNILFVIKCLVAIGINSLTHYALRLTIQHLRMALHQVLLQVSFNQLGLIGVSVCLTVWYSSILAVASLTCRLI